MPDDFLVPDLRFPTVGFGRNETPWDLRVLLYKGGAAGTIKNALWLIQSGQLEGPLPERLSIVQKIHEVIEGKQTGGGSKSSAANQIGTIRRMFAWSEEAQLRITLASIQECYLEWADSLEHRWRTRVDLGQRSAYSIGALVGSLLDEVLERKTPMIGLTRLRMPPQRKTARGVQAEKQNLEDTFAFGNFLQDVCDGLPLDVVMRGLLPVCVSLRHPGELLLWSGARIARYSKDALSKRQAEGTLLTRSPLANIRIEAELLMFIGQTGMNLAQAQNLELRNFFYVSHLDGYQVKDWKGRRGGAVLFEIFKDYKPHFERYLAWRRNLFPRSHLLFPFVRSGGRSPERVHQFLLRRHCKNLEIRFVSPRDLRNTRVNWLLRRSGDVAQTAEQAQHTKETLLRVYDRPSQQRAMGELMQFWSSKDPTVIQEPSVAPGGCEGEPKGTPDLPERAAKPDCVRPSGCLWCENHRDLDHQDYVWSLTSFRHLKIIEVSKWQAPKDAPEVHPAQHSVDRITEKLQWFRTSNALRRSWVEEALMRIDEGAYHPAWQTAISAMDGEK